MKPSIRKLKKGDWHGALLPPGAPVQKAIRSLNETCLHLVLVVDPKGKLLGTVTDGDIRRGLLRGHNLETSLGKIMHRKPWVARPHHDAARILKMMMLREIQQVPVVDAGRRVIGLHILEKMVSPQKRQNLLVIMAGGEGRRLYPYTQDRPKALVPVAGRPLVEHIVVKAREEGFHQLVIAVRHFGGMIEDYFQDGSKWAVQIKYCREKKPLGTAGAIRLLPKPPKQPFLVTNGDVLADFSYGGLLDFHISKGAMATMAVRLFEWQNPFGVIQTKGFAITSFEEKPVIRSQINAGVYALSPEVLRHVPANRSWDMPELFEALRKKGLPTLAFPIHERWFDIGRPEDLAAANQKPAPAKKGGSYFKKP